MSRGTGGTLSFNELVGLFNSEGSYGKPFQDDGKWFQYRLYFKPNNTTEELELGVLRSVSDEDTLKFDRYAVACYPGHLSVYLGEIDGPYTNNRQRYLLDSSVAEQAPIFIEKKEQLPIYVVGGGGKSKKNRRRCKRKRTRRQRSR